MIRIHLMRFAMRKLRDNACTWKQFDWKENTIQSQVGNRKHFDTLCILYQQKQAKYRLNNLLSKYKSFYV